MRDRGKIKWNGAWPYKSSAQCPQQWSVGASSSETDLGSLFAVKPWRERENPDDRQNVDNKMFGSLWEFWENKGTKPNKLMTLLSQNIIQCDGNCISQWKEIYSKHNMTAFWLTKKSTLCCRLSAAMLRSSKAHSAVDTCLDIWMMMTLGLF